MIDASPRSWTIIKRKFRIILKYWSDCKCMSFSIIHCLSAILSLIDSENQMKSHNTWSCQILRSFKEAVRHRQSILFLKESDVNLLLNYLVLFVKTFKQILRLLWRLNQFCQFYWLVLCDNTEDVIFLAASLDPGSSNVWATNISGLSHPSSSPSSH